MFRLLLFFEDAESATIKVKRETIWHVARAWRRPWLETLFHLVTLVSYQPASTLVKQITHSHVRRT